MSRYHTEEEEKVWQEDYVQVRKKADLYVIERYQRIPEYFTGRAYNIIHEWVGHYVDGALHSTDDNPSMIYGGAKDSGYRPNPRRTDRTGYYEFLWYNHGQPHRGDGKPSIVSRHDESYSWYVDGVQHREDGPIYEYMYPFDTAMYDEVYMLHGRVVTFEAFELHYMLYKNFLACVPRSIVHVVSA